MTRLEQFPNLLVIVKSMSLGDPPQNPFNSIDLRRTWARWRALDSEAPERQTVCARRSLAGMIDGGT